MTQFTLNLPSDHYDAKDLNGRIVYFSGNPADVVGEGTRHPTFRPWTLDGCVWGCFTGRWDEVNDGKANLPRRKKLPTYIPFAWCVGMNREPLVP